MAVPSPRRSPARPMATGAARRVRASSTARPLFSSYRDVCGGVERGRDGSVERRRDGSVERGGVERRRAGSVERGVAERVRGVSVERGAVAPWRRELSLRGQDRQPLTHIPHSRGIDGRPGHGYSMMLLSRLSYGSGSGSAAYPPQIRGSAPIGWGSAPVDLLRRIFEKLDTAERFWAVTHVCSGWRFAAFLLARPMSLAMSAMVLDPFPYPLTPFKLLIAKPSMARDGKMETGRIFGYHSPSASFGVAAGSRVIGSFSGIPVFLSDNGQLELPSVCSSSLAEFVAQRHVLPVGIPAEDVYMGTIDEDKIALVTEGSLLMSRGTSPGAWFIVTLSDFQINRITSIVFANGVLYLLDDQRRLFKAEFRFSSVAMVKVELITDLPERQLWERLWLIKCPIGATVLCVCYREVHNQYQFLAYDLDEEDDGWSWVLRNNLGDMAVFVNWGQNTIGFAHTCPRRWCLRRNHVYQSHTGQSCLLNQPYNGRIMPREVIRWPFPLWMLAAPSDLDNCNS